MTPNNCPNTCGSLSSASYEGIDVDYCTTCRGVWLDYGKLTQIILTRQRTWSSDRIRKVLTRLSGFNAPPMPEGRELRCPRCSDVLDEVNYQGTSNIIVNPCGDLHGVWLDAGEIASIQIYMEHWQDYARDHAEEIRESLDEIADHFHAYVEHRYVDEGVSSSRLANQLVFEALELLDGWRGSRDA